MADATLSFALEQLLTGFSEEPLLQNDAVFELQSHRKSVQNFLRNYYSSNKRQNGDADAFVGAITSVLYKIEIALDKFYFHKAKSKVGSSLVANQRFPNFNGEIESIRDEMKENSNLRAFIYEGLRLGEHRNSCPTAQMIPIADQDMEIDLKEESKTVISILRGGSEDFEVLSITGMAGLGKTILAQIVFNDPLVVSEFNTRAMVYAPHEFSVKDILLSIIRKITLRETSYDDNQLNHLVTEFQSTLQDKYLIVIDGLATISDWNKLSQYFPDNKKGGRVLITTQHRLVPLHGSSISNPHHLRFLTLDESWKLLRRRVNRLGEDPWEKNLEAVEKKIAADCEGLPLAIEIIARFLASKENLKYWCGEVVKNVTSYIVRDERLFFDIPYYLKSCFFYFAMFPENYEISAKKLTQLWIAEGFIEEPEEACLEDTAMEYLNELFNRNLVIVEQRNLNGCIKTCRLHKVLYGFCRREAKKENFFVDMNVSKQGKVNKCYRLCVNNNNVFGSLPPRSYGELVRSFLCSAPEVTEDHTISICRALPWLRVLDIATVNLFRFERSILQLNLLRYLGISGNFRSLPADISNLLNLQTLLVDSQTSNGTLQIHANIWKMLQLRHLKVNASICLPSRSNVAFVNENLQSLSNICPENCNEDVLARAPNIRKLGIRGKLAPYMDNGSKLVKNIGKLQHLESLKLLNEGFQLHTFPQLESPKLEKLTLAATSLDWRHMSALRLLPNLKVLKLKEKAFVGEVWKVDYMGFRRLRVLHIDDTEDLVSWEASGIHFPSLERLIIKKCNDLLEVPVDLIRYRQ